MPLGRIIGSALFAAAVTLGAAAAALTPTAARAEIGSYLLFDVASGEILAAHEPVANWYPASLTKLMTAYVAFRDVADGTLALTSPVTMTPQAHQQPPSRMGFAVGTVMTLDTALRVILTKSANDVTVALAEAVGGTQEGFVRRMNDAAAQLGMTATRYDNPHGLPNVLQVTSARDLALLVMALRRDFSDRAEYFAMGGIVLASDVTPNHNALVRRFRGADGMKTGFICASGFNLAATATRDGRVLGAIVLGGLTARERDERTAELLAKGFVAVASGGEITLDGFGDPSDPLAVAPVHGSRPGMGTVGDLIKGDQPVVDRRDEVCGPARSVTRYDGGTVDDIATVEEQRRSRMDSDRRRADRDRARRDALSVPRTPPPPSPQPSPSPSPSGPLASRILADDDLVPVGWQPSSVMNGPFRNPSPRKSSGSVPPRSASAALPPVDADWRPSWPVPKHHPFAIATLRVALGEPPPARPLTYLDAPRLIAPVVIRLGGADPTRPSPLSGMIVGGGAAPVPVPRPHRTPLFGAPVDPAEPVFDADEVRAKATARREVLDGAGDEVFSIVR